MWRDWKRWLLPLGGLLLFAFFLYRFDALLALLMTFLSIISPFIIGLFLALLINLPMRRLDGWLSYLLRDRRLFPMRRAISLTLSVLIVFAVISVLLVVIIPEVIAAVERLIRVLPNHLKNLEIWLVERNASLRQTLGLVDTEERDVRDLFQQAYQFLVGGLSYSSGVVLSAAQYLVNLIVALVFAIYLLFSKERVKGQFVRLLRAALPGQAGRSAIRVTHLLQVAYSNFLAGQLLQALISSLLTVLTLLLFGFPYPVLIGLITFVAAFIPVFGPFISGILGALLVLTVSPGQALWFLLAFFVVQQLAGSVIYPRIMSSAIDMPSIWVLVAVTLGGGILGIPGMLLFIPLMSVIYRLTSEFVQRRERRNDPQEQPLDPA